MVSVKDQILNALTWFKAKLNTWCVNNCVSTITTAPLAASQGKVLQDQIHTLNASLSKIRLNPSHVLITQNPLVPSTAGTTVSKTISGLSQFSHVKMYVNIGDCFNNWIDFYVEHPNNVRVTAGNSSGTYRGRITVTCNFSQNTISIMADELKGWTANQCSISKVIALERV